MGRTETKFLLAFTLLGIVGSYASDTTTIQKLGLVAGPFVVWLLLKRIVRMLSD